MTDPIAAHLAAVRRDRYSAPRPVCTSPASEVERAPEYDGHTPQEAAERLRQAARDGQYVTAEHAAANPDTTVREDDSRVRELQDRLDAVVALARKWATQPTDWDEDTEQQIEDGTELLTLLGLTLEEQP